MGMSLQDFQQGRNSASVFSVYGVIGNILLDSASDVSSLPTDGRYLPGSTATVIATGDKYVLNGAGSQWIVAKSEASIPAPTSASDAGKVPTVNATGTGYALQTPPAFPQGAAVADAAGEAPTATEYNALLASLRAAGLISTAAEEETEGAE